MHNLKLMFAFALHIVVAVALFSLIGGAAALLNIYTTLLEKVGMSPLIIQSIHLTEYLLFAADLVCFIVYTGREVWLLLTDIMRPAHFPDENH